MACYQGLEHAGPQARENVIWIHAGTQQDPKPPCQHHLGQAGPSRFTRAPRDDRWLNQPLPGAQAQPRHQPHQSPMTTRSGPRAPECLGLEPSWSTHLALAVLTLGVSHASPERAPLHVLPTEPHVDALLEQGAKGHVLCQCPVGRALPDHVCPATQDTREAYEMGKEGMAGNWLGTTELGMQSRPGATGPQLSRSTPASFRAAAQRPALPRKHLPSASLKGS